MFDTLTWWKRKRKESGSPDFSEDGIPKPLSRAGAPEKPQEERDIRKMVLSWFDLTEKKEPERQVFQSPESVRDLISYGPQMMTSTIYFPQEQMREVEHSMLFRQGGEHFYTHSYFPATVSSHFQGATFNINYDVRFD